MRMRMCDSMHVYGHVCACATVCSGVQRCACVCTCALMCLYVDKHEHKHEHEHEHVHVQALPRMVSVSLGANVRLGCALVRMCICAVNVCAYLRIDVCAFVRCAVGE